MKRRFNGIASWTMTSLLTLGLGAGVVLMTGTNGVVTAAAPSSTPSTSVATTAPTTVGSTSRPTTISFKDDGVTYTVLAGSAASHSDY